MAKPMIYVAEPSRILSRIISTQLEAAGYETQIFSNGLAVLKKIVCEDPSLIICDRDMTVINGLELCSILKTGSSKSNIPIILMAQNNRGVPTYDGRSDIVRFLANIHPARIPWKKYTLS